MMVTPTPPTMAGAFSNGYGAGRMPSLSPGLEAQGARWSQQSLASASAPHSVLSQLSPSPIRANLSAASGQSRLLPNGLILPNNANGAAGPTAETENYLQMEGAE
jgi:hypothetical protein